MYCDTHCHLDFDVYDSDRQEVIDRSKEAELAFVINPGIDLASSRAAIRLAQVYPGFMHATVGIHPNYVYACNENSLSELHALATQSAVVAIGEIGLDYYRDYSEPAQQRRYFLEQLEFASQLELPVVIHNRDASQDLVPILSDWYFGLPQNSRLKQYSGDMHSYSDGLDTALSLANMGFYFGIGGPVTFHNASWRREIASGLPLERILLETDAPFLTPHPHRGKRNEPAFIPLIAAEIAKLQGKTSQEIGQITTANAATLFSLGLPESPENLPVKS